MTKKCPNCGKEIANQEEICPNCGYHFEQAEQKEPSDATEHNFSNEDQNENIEWSELKDMSLGHVMNMFNEQHAQTTNKKEAEESEKETEAAAIEENSSSLNSEPDVEVTPEKQPETDKHVEEEKAPNMEEELEVAINRPSEPTVKKTVEEDQPEQQQEKSEETVEASEIEAEEITVVSSSALQKYIQAHKSDTEVGTESNKVEEPSSEKTEEEMKENSNDEIEEKEDKIEEKLLPATESDSGVENTDEKVDTEKPIKKEETPKKKTLVKQPIGIPSKSKKPEEIEMDKSPIFFKDETKPIGPTNKKQISKEAPKEETKKKVSADSVPQKKNTKLYITAAAIVLVAAGGWFAYSQNASNTAKKTQTEETTDSAAKNLETSLNSYFTDESQVFLKPEMVGISTDSLKKELDQAKGASNYKELTTLYELVEAKQKQTQSVNQLFEEPVINGKEIKEGTLAQDKAITLKKVEEKDGLDKLFNEGISQADNQYKQLQTAKSAVAVFYADGQLNDQLSRETYNTAKAEVDKVKSSKLKKTLVETLTKANQTLVAAEEATAQQAASQAQTAAATETNEAPTNTAGTTVSGTTNQAVDASGFSAPNSNGVYTDPVYTVNPSDVADTGNPAWIWGAGIKEQVLATVIQRGYVVEGGYILEPARIVNGQGYYNLYATNTNSALLSGTPESSLPVYIVTINAQTGWFKGNASRNAGN